jgi:precorrin-6A/cobalt-precorrin-6A reductase
MKVLLLAGTAEARRLAALLEGAPEFEAIASLAGVTDAPLPMPARTRTGGFGGEAQQERFIAGNGFDAVIDATHPFAKRISLRTQAICARLGRPYLQLLRPAWSPTPGDLWFAVQSGGEARTHIPAGARVFLATGQKKLAEFANLQDCHLVCRRIDPAPAGFPWPNGEYLVARPPFTIEQERRLFARLGIDWLVVKNAGGQAGRAKLDAARDLGLPVVMIERPAQPPGDKVETPEAAMQWLRARL